MQIVIKTKGTSIILEDSALLALLSALLAHALSSLYAISALSTLSFSLVISASAAVSCSSIVALIDRPVCCWRRERWLHQIRASVRVIRQVFKVNIPKLNWHRGDTMIMHVAYHEALALSASHSSTRTANESACASSFPARLSIAAAAV